MAVEGLRSSTNWVVAGGSLPESISFETSDDDSPSSLASGGVILVRPPSHDSLPCEITVHFEKQHEIHRVYVQSSARTYEIYFTLNDNREYLCTVRCGEAAKDDQHFTFMDGSGDEMQNGDYDTVEREKGVNQIQRNDSNRSNEDGWIEVGLPDKIQINEENLILYEATAEISDANPCESITIRFLSLQEKSLVHISEVYIFADPVEVPKVNNVCGIRDSLGGSSLLAMFVPQLLQLSKSGRKEMQDNSYYNSSGASRRENEHSNLDTKESAENGKYSINTDKDAGIDQEKLQRTTEKLKLTHAHNSKDEAFSHKVHQTSEFVEVTNELVQTPKPTGFRHLSSGEGVYSSTLDQLGSSEQTMRNLNNAQPARVQEVASDDVSKHTKEECGFSGDRTERMLDELITRVGRIEGFLLRFEENMIKPLDCIEKRLQKLEHMFDSVGMGNHFHEPCSSTRISPSEFSISEPDPGITAKSGSQVMSSEETLCHGPSSEVDKALVRRDTSMCDRLVVKAPELCSVDDTCSGLVFKTPEFCCVDDTCPGLTVKTPEFCSVDDTCSGLAVKALQLCSVDHISSGLAVKAPEFCSVDDGYDMPADTLTYSAKDSNKCDDTIDFRAKTCCNNDAIADSDAKNYIEGRKKLSVDYALASALASFMCTKPANEMKTSFDLSSFNMCEPDPSEVPHKVVDPHSKHDLEKNCHSLPELVNKEASYDGPPLSVDLDSSNLSSKSESNLAERTLPFAAGYFIDDSKPSVSGSQMVSGMVMMAPDFVSDEDVFIGYEENAKLNGEICCQVQPLMSSFNIPNLSLHATSDVSVYDKTSFGSKDETCNQDIDNAGASSERGNVENNDIKIKDAYDCNPISSSLSLVLSLDCKEYKIKNQSSLEEELFVGPDSLDCTGVPEATINRHCGQDENGCFVVGEDDHGNTEGKNLDFSHEKDIENPIDVNQLVGLTKEIDPMNQFNGDTMAGYFNASANQDFGLYSDIFSMKKASEQSTSHQDIVRFDTEIPSANEKYETAEDPSPTSSVGNPSLDTTLGKNCPSELSLEVLLYEAFDLKQATDLEYQEKDSIVKQQYSIPSKSDDGGPLLVDLGDFSSSNQTSALHHDQVTQDPECSKELAFSSLI